MSTSHPTPVTVRIDPSDPPTDSDARSHNPASSVLQFNELPRGAGGVGATEMIARALQRSGIDVPASLYDEALALARQGRLAPATERLRMLLTLDPSDGEASLLLGKTLAARGLWQEALSALDGAVANGVVLPPGLREQVEANLRKQVEDAEEYRARIAARERGEIKKLRSESKRLRSENAFLEQQLLQLSKRVRFWSSATALALGSAAALLLASLLFGGPSSDTDAAPAEQTPAGNSATETAPAASAKAVSPPPHAARPSTAPQSVASPVAMPEPKPSTSQRIRTIYTVRRGDTLGHIARRFYGKSSLWPVIRDANEDVLHGGVALHLGMKLKIPEKP